ncbi:MAG: hypothetical protein M3547_03540 [Acidobacteriota bacterium]|nr:hypothetical protein [Acidobacteriota bacterium]
MSSPPDTAGRWVFAPSARRRPFLPILALSVLALGILLYLPTFSASYAYDDMDYLNAAADVLAGKSGYWENVFRPHLEHLVPTVRMAFHASALLFGAWALPFRLLIFLAHVGSAVFLGLTARRYSETDAAGYAAALAYVVPCGFSSMWVWLPTGAGVPFGLLGITGAMAALANRTHLGAGKARVLAGAGALFALLCENSLAPLLACPALVDEYERRRAGRARGLGGFTVFAGVAVIFWSVLSSFLYARLTGEGFTFNLRRGIFRAAFLLLVAPFRYLFPGLPLSRPGEPPRTALIVGSLLGLVVAGVAGALLLGLSRGKRAPLLVVAALSAVGPVGVIGLVGLRRWRFLYEELYDADRYFFTLLIPISLLAAFAVDRVRTLVESWGRAERACLVLLLSGAFGAELLAHRSALLRRFPRQVFDTHELRFSQLGLLAARLNDAARRLPPGDPPLQFPDSAIWFPDVHNGRLSSRLLLAVVNRAPSPRLQLGGPVVGPEDERRLNPVLAAWAGDVGEALPYLSIESGTLVNARESGIADFRNHAAEASVVSGFYAWEGSSRWMGRRGELRLVMKSPRLTFLLAAPMSSIRRVHPDWESIHVKVTLVDEATGYVAPAGVLRVTEDGMREYRLEAPEIQQRLGNARRVHLVLETEKTWRPVETLPGSHDPRELTVQVFRAGFEP